MISVKKTPIHLKVEQQVLSSLWKVKSELTSLHMMYADETIMREYVKEICSSKNSVKSMLKS